jgi:hypothetical protein
MLQEVRGRGTNGEFRLGSAAASGASAREIRRSRVAKKMRDLDPKYRNFNGCMRAHRPL